MSPLLFQVYTLSGIHKNTSNTPEILHRRAKMPLERGRDTPFLHFFYQISEKNLFFVFLVLTSDKIRVESRSRRSPRQPTRKEATKMMKTIAIVLGLTTLTAVGNTLPPTPEAVAIEIQG